MAKTDALYFSMTILKAICSLWSRAKKIVSAIAAALYLSRSGDRDHGEDIAIAAKL